MIQMNSRVFIADNTGAKSAEMIRRLGQNKDTADVGDVVVCAVKEGRSRSCRSRSHKSSDPSW